MGKRVCVHSKHAMSGCNDIIAPSVVPSPQTNKQTNKPRSSFDPDYATTIQMARFKVPHSFPAKIKGSDR